MAATEARNYGNKARGVERRKLQNEETEAKKRIILTQKKISKNIIKTSGFTTSREASYCKTNRRNRLSNK